MRKGRVFTWLLILGMAACARDSEPGSMLYRCIDHLEAEGVLASPLADVVGKSVDTDEVFPAASSPLVDRGSGENPYGIKRKLKVGGTDRNVLYSPPGTELRFRIPRPAGAVLEFGIGIVPGASGEGGAGVVFLAALEAGGGRRQVFQKFLPAPSAGDEPAFSWHRLRLPDLSRNARLILSTQGQGRAHAFWFNPVVFRPEATGRFIILISVDTLRADHLGCYGYSRKTSPNVDALASESVLFLNTYAASPWTLPSHVSMLTGLYGVHHQVYREDQIMDPEMETLADALRTRGLQCAAFTGGGFVSSVYGFSKGFASYSDDAGGVFRQDSAGHLLRLAAQWLQSQKDRSFFLFLHTYQPHNPYACPYPYKTLFVEKGAEWRHIDLLGHLGGRAGIFRPLPEAQRRNAVALYDGEIRYTDEALVGPLLEKLKDLGIYDQAMIVFTSDHGEEFFEHQGWGHGHSLYEESLRVPLIIKFPGSRYAGRVVASRVSLADIFPTVLDVLGKGTVSGGIDGRSLLPLITGEEKEDRVFFADIAADVLQSRIPQKIAMSAGDKKLILNRPFSREDLEFFLFPPPQVKPVELFDLEKDPEERENVADSHPELVRRIIQAVQRLYDEAELRKTRKLEIDEELKEQLKALGYIR